MNYKRHLFLFSLICLPIFLDAKVVTDTLRVRASKGQVYVTYEVEQENGQVTVSFNNVRKVGMKNVDEAVFFDKTGVYKDMRFEGLPTKAFMISRDKMHYTMSKDGYFLMSQSAKLSFTVKTDKPQTLAIPIYLAEYKKKGVYNIICQCDDLIIRFDGTKKKSQPAFEGYSVVEEKHETIESSEEIEVDKAEQDAEFKAFGVASAIEELLQKDLLSESQLIKLNGCAQTLRELEYFKFSNVEIEDKVKDALKAYDSFMLKMDAAKEARDKRDQYIRDSTENALKKQQDDDKIKAEEEKQRNFWLMIGGIVLAVVCFVGNQAYQSYRNKKNLERQEKKQQDMIREAKMEAKRRARKAANDIAKNSNKNGKNNNGYSI